MTTTLTTTQLASVSRRLTPVTLLVPAPPREKPPAERIAEVRAAVAALDAVGSEYGIALYLDDHGIRGRRSATDCPVARYIFVKTSHKVLLGAVGWRLWDFYHGWEPIPSNVDDFIFSFDNYRYLHLLAGS